MKLIREINRALQRDAETVPLDSFSTISFTVAEYGAPRLPALAEILEANPQTRGCTQLFLEELLVRSRRQVGGGMALYKTFVDRMAEIDADTLDALPEHSRKALDRLKDRASKAPVPMPDALMFAHSLTIDGELCRYLSGEPEKPKATPQAVYRELARQNHPDKGGNTEVMAAVNKLWNSVRGAT